MVYRHVRRHALAFALVTLLTALLGLFFARSLIIDRIGGDFAGPPAALRNAADGAAKQLIEQAFADVDSSRLRDYGVHLLGTGLQSSGIVLHPKQLSWAQPGLRLRNEVIASAAGLTQLDFADRGYRRRLDDLLNNFPGWGRSHLLALDRHYDLNGQLQPQHSALYVANDYAAAQANNRRGRYAAVASIHPYRRDALDALRRWRDAGVRYVHWQPQAQGIDPADPAIDAFYANMKTLGMVLVTDARAAGTYSPLNNPLRLRRPLRAGVKVIMLFAANGGRNNDLDDAQQATRSSFKLGLRLLDEPEWNGRLFAGLAGISRASELPEPLETLLQRPDLWPRLVNASGYPLPGVNWLIRTGALAEHGFLDAAEVAPLNSIYQYNPLLYDYVLKRRLRLPGTELRLPPEVFMTHTSLPAP